MKDQSFIKQAPSAIFLPSHSLKFPMRFWYRKWQLPPLYSFKPKPHVHASLVIPQMEVFVPAQHSPLFLCPPSTGHMKGRKCKDRVTFLASSIIEKTAVTKEVRGKQETQCDAYKIFKSKRLIVPQLPI